jgi:hypothetical protein
MQMDLKESLGDIKYLNTATYKIRILPAHFSCVNLKKVS